VIKIKAVSFARRLFYSRYATQLLLIVCGASRLVVWSGKEKAMRLVNIVTLIGVSTVVLSAATAGFANPTTSSSAPTTAQSAPVTQSGVVASSATTSVTTPATNADDERRVCRQRDTLGSRLRPVRVCKTQAEWRRIDGAGRETGKSITDRGPGYNADPKMGGG
jgi:hypothetical protein